MSVIGEAALSALFEVLFDKLTSSDLLNIFKQEQVDADLKKWKTMLLKIRAVLDDAEEKQVTSRLVKLWLDELEDLAYDADDILDEFSIEALRHNTGGRTRATRSRVPTTCLVNESYTYGRDEDKTAIVKMLLSGESSHAQLSVIPILVKLKENLSGKKFLLVLDDVWNEDYDVWTKLRSPFEFGAQGSKIIITTRNDGVSSTMGTTPAYKLKELSKDACLHVFTQHALGETDFTAHPELEEIGRKILDKCKGSPLAAKVLGGALPIAHYSQKDYEFEKKELVLLWMAEGLVQETKRNEPMEDLGGEYFRDLLGRSFFQQSSSNKSLFVMHDLINDLARWAAGGLCYILEDTMGSNKQSKISTKLPEKIGNLVNLRHLDITNVNLIKEMPVGIGELKSLQTLSNFVVGKDTGSKIGDLMNLKFLQGRICISRLENVLDVEDARRANLNGKKNLDELAMKWESADDDLQDAKVAIDVLDMLRPWTTVKELSIDGYVGVKFPTWLGHPSFSNMVLLRIESCKKCTSLPAIGQLPSLKNLVIIGMANVQRVGLEFYGEGCLKPFQSLETLCFEDLQEWQDWIPSGVEYEEFPRLRELSISRCPKLQGKLPYHLPSLEKFSICKCEELVVSIPSLPMLHKLEIVGCKEVVRRNTVELCSLKSIVFSIPDLKSLTEEFMHGLVKVENLTIDDCKELTSMWQDKLMYLVALDIQSCPSLITLNLMSRIRTLTIKGCSALQSLPISNCTCLEYATIEECNSLTFISRGQLPSTLKRLEIRNCENLQIVFDEGEATSSCLLMNEDNLNTSLLERLIIRSCPSLKILSSRGDLPAMLKILQIGFCSELTSLSSSGQLPTALKYLYVKSCPKLESVADKLHNNVSLEALQIMNCGKLKSLPEGLHKLCHLIKMKIEGYSSLVSFPDGGLLPTSLRQLSISFCEKLEALPNRMHNLTSLDLIRDCGSIISFPEEGYPTNLTSLYLKGVNICKQVFEWGLHRLTSLTYLYIEGGFPDWQSFPSEEEDGKMMMTLPTSLTTLFINSFPNIVFLSSKGFQNLSALQQLLIFNCPTLEFLPEKGLPPSLLDLSIYNCPLLKQHCKKGKGREWLKIANIPRVLIDSRNISKLEGKAVNASQALNYCKHMVMICQEAVAGNHSLRRLALRFAAFVVENRQAGRYKLLSKTLLAVLHQRSSKLWFRQVPRPILTNARQQTAKQFNSFSKSGNYKCFYCLHFMHLQFLQEAFGSKNSITSLLFLFFISLFGFQNLSDLEQLDIRDFPKLEFLPEKGLPPSLLDLYIYNCPLLKQHCKKGKGREWFKIANIPCVKIDDRAVWFGSNLTLRSDLFNPLLHYGLDSKLVTEIKNNNDTWTNLFYTFATTGCGRFEIFKNKAATEGSEINAVSMLDYSKEMEQLRRDDYSLKKDQVVNLREVLQT
uniref:Rx N-terminal domain-containing protein n=1 Tax=Fagus sylvatica TaxID=28930 RepID=A0A2N9IY16_FAGSY